MNVLNGILRLGVGGAFVLAGALKIADPPTFALAVGNFRLLPVELVNWVAVMLPSVEVVAGLLVLAGWWLRAASVVIVGLTSVFAVAIASALARGLNIECGCFGTIAGRRIGLSSLAIDVVLLGMATLLAWRAGASVPKRFPVETGERTSASPREVSPG